VVRDLTERLQKQATERAEYQRRYGIQTVPQGMAKQLQAAQGAARGGDGDEEGGGDSSGSGARGGPGILA
jgi:hypothetical protein